MCQRVVSQHRPAVHACQQPRPAGALQRLLCLVRSAAAQQTATADQVQPRSSNRTACPVANQIRDEDQRRRRAHNECAQAAAAAAADHRID